MGFFLGFLGVMRFFENYGIFLGFMRLLGFFFEIFGTFLRFIKFFRDFFEKCTRFFLSDVNSQVSKSDESNVK